MKTILTIFLIIISDSVTKWWASSQLPDISLAGNWIHITHIKNTGIAFSTPLVGIYFLIPLILCGLLFFIIKSWKNLSKQERLGYALILTGGLLNAIERSIFGSVTDMIGIQYFAIFNIADIAVTCGVICILGKAMLFTK